MTAKRFRFDYCDEPLPSPLGRSPFRIKGEFYRQAAISLAHHDARSDGRLRTILDREGLLDFSKQAFLSSSLYDILPMPRLMMAAAEARDREVRELAETLSRASVQAQMTGVYGSILNALTPASFCQRFDQAIAHFYNFAPLRMVPVPDGADIVRSGMPLCVAEWWSLSSAPFMRVPLELNGASEVEISSRIEPGESISGTPCGNVYTRVRWRLVSAKEG